MYHSVFNLGTRAFPFPRHGKGPGNEVDSVLFGSAISKAILYFFCLLPNAFPDFGSVGWSEKKKTPKKKRNGEEVSN